MSTDNSKKKSVIYLDNAGTTPINEEVLKTIFAWCKNAQNPSSSSKIAKESKEIIEKARKAMQSHCNAHKYKVVFTSCGSESNCMIIKSAVESYKRILKVTPTVIVSAIEHSSIMKCCESLEKNNLANICYIMPNIDGVIPVSSVELAINSHQNVAIISIMFANNELGSINNIKEIGAITRRARIPLHVDAVQMFGKFVLDLEYHNIDALSASFHKFNGPKGLGLLFIKDDLVDGYELEGQISGSQQFGLRAGTENVAFIACSIVALTKAFENRSEKTAKMYSQRKYVIEELRKLYKFGNYADYVLKGRQDFVDGSNTEFDASYDGFVYDSEAPGEDVIKPRDPVELLLLGPGMEKAVLPNIITLAVIKNIENNLGMFCNIKLKEELDANNCVVSIGSVCNTENKEASHVIKNIRAPPIVRRGIIRISLGDTTTKDELDRFIKIFDKAVKSQIFEPTKKESTPRKPREPKEMKETKKAKETSVSKPTKVSTQKNKKLPVAKNKSIS